MKSSERAIAVFAVVCLVVFIIGFSYLLFFSGKTGIPGLEGIRSWKISLFVPADEKAYQRVRVAYDMNDAKKSMGYVEDFLVEYPNSKFRNKVLLTAATIFFENKDYTSAKKYAMNVIDTLNRDDKKSEAPDYIDAIILLGKISKENGFYEPVVVNFLEDVYMRADDTKKSEIAIYLGYANLYQKNYTNALRYFNSMSGEFSLIGRARVYIEMNKYAEAIQEYINYFNIYPKSERYDNVKIAFVKQSFFYADQLKRTGSYDQVLQYLINVANYFPRDNSADEALIRIAMVYGTHKDYSNALSFLNKALNNSVTSGDDWAMFEKGMIYYDMGKKSESARTYQELLDKYPKSSYARKAAEWKEMISKEEQAD